MEKDQILNFLIKYDYKYTVDSASITVNLDFAQKVILDFSQPGKLIIIDQLTGWNFLTGLIQMSLKNAMIYNFVCAVILAFLFLNLPLSYSGVNFIPIYLLFMLWVLLFSGYYLVKLESFKSQIMALKS